MDLLRKERVLEIENLGIFVVDWEQVRGVAEEWRKNAEMSE